MIEHQYYVSKQAKAIPTQKIVNSPVNVLKFDEQIGIILQWAKNFESMVVCVANVHMLIEAYRQPSFARILENADLVTPDGMPLVWMLQLLGAKNQNRVAGLDILLELCRLAPQQNISIYFVGSETRVLEQMRQKLKVQFPDLKIAGMEPLPFRPLTPGENDALIKNINQSRAGLVFVALGCPKQEYWMAQNKGKIKAVMIGLGGAFPMYAGIHKRAPLWLQKLGLEWAYRLIQEPKRLWKRYCTTNGIFIYLALKQLLIQRINQN
ncbi:WecB/TagA/CpsF family glycosyltransferase [Desmonostoc muscorum LEGE 12446]|uniref:WecB/TagA/CpsF family glycosyltransferase n=1 Tax=Desmonostoc muscorum LEGE 12446 TaxID=1828758 RepID=A0A8J7DE25_DESMC|nr:WecB/TagA/CpsF family glycosyltransferase [Desmonostoc muscorum]MCF2146314.1 WecB/TagA/CpsF family glycosyltransferase [Desmonostoc muscorum LEGE 12446]